MLSLNDLIARRQTNRILRIEFPHADGPPAQLLPQRVHAVEALSRDF
jgi:type VI secretion system secreted protein VgrG